MPRYEVPRCRNGTRTSELDRRDHIQSQPHNMCELVDYVVWPREHGYRRGNLTVGFRGEGSPGAASVAIPAAARFGSGPSLNPHPGWRRWHPEPRGVPTSSPAIRADVVRRCGIDRHSLADRGSGARTRQVYAAAGGSRRRNPLRCSAAVVIRAPSCPPSTKRDPISI